MLGILIPRGSQFNEHEVLTSPGKVKAKIAEEFAKEQYEVFHQQRLTNPSRDDFDQFLENHHFKK